MKRTLFILIAVSIVLFAACSFQPGGVKTNGEDIDVLWEDSDAPYYEGKLIIGYVDRSAVDEIVNLLNARIAVEIEKLNAVSIEFDCSVEEARSKIKNFLMQNSALSNRIRYIEPSYERSLVEPVKASEQELSEILGVDVTKPLSKNGVIPDLMEYVWGVKKVKAPEAWNLGYDGSGILVAVLDTGIDATHPDLQDQIAKRYDPVLDTEVATNIDYSFEAHATHVAGTIAAKADGQGVTGVAPGAKLIDIPIFQPDYIGDSYVALGIIWAVDNGAKVLSNSWGGKGYSTLLHDAINYALENGAIFVASAGNSHTDEVHYPSCYPGVINVAASTAVDGITDFSTRGEWVTVAAPGDYTVLSSVPLWDTGEFTFEQPYAFYGGTSMACPHVSGAVAILLQSFLGTKVVITGYTGFQIKSWLTQSADDIMAPGFDEDSGWGRINVENALGIDPSTLPEGGSMEFTVLSDRYILGDHYPLSGVYITLIPNGHDGPAYYGKTVSDGTVKFSDIESGSYDAYIGFGDFWDMYSLRWTLRTEDAFGIQDGVNVSSSVSKTYYLSNTPKVVITDFSSDPSGEFQIRATESLSSYQETKVFATASPGIFYVVSADDPGGLYNFEISFTSGQLTDITVEGYVEYNDEDYRQIPFSVDIPAGSTDWFDIGISYIPAL